MRFESGTLKRGALALAFGVALLVGASATANAQHARSRGGYQNNGHGGYSQHERRDVQREVSHHQRDNRSYNNNGYYNSDPYYNNNGYYNQRGGYNNNNGYYNQRGGYSNNGSNHGGGRNNHQNRRHH